MSEKLTDRQASILNRAAGASGSASTYWLSGGSMETKAAYAACQQLERKGLLSCDRDGYWPYWRITDAGRAGLTPPNTEASC